MKFIQLVLFSVIVLGEINYVYTSSDGINYSNSNLSKPDNKTAICTNKKSCVMKCCPLGTFVNRKKVFNKNNPGKKKTVRFCDNYNQTRNMSDLILERIFYNNPNMSFEIKYGIYEVNDSFRAMSINVANLADFNVYLTMESQLHLETPNAYDRWTKFTNDQFCWDYMINRMKLVPGIWVLFPEDDEGDTGRTTNILQTSAMLASSFFLFLVLVVYSLLPELRNLCGLILMSYVASLLGAFLLLGIMRVQQQESTTCLTFTLAIYFLFLASFSWMNVMSYDIWWTFRGYAKARPIHRRGEYFKLLMYSLYAWGLPMAMTIGLGVLNNTDMRDKPWFVTPKIPTSGCFIENGEKFYYLYIPMLILIMCNWMFFLMTAFNIWRLSRGTAVLDSAAAGTPQAHRTHFNRFLVYLKLSVVMGLNWVLEVMSYLYPSKSSLWVVSDFYNLLIGLSIFLIFVCKRKILRKLTKLFLRLKKAPWRLGQMTSSTRSTSTSEGSTSQETQTLQVCSNPKGPKGGYPLKSF